MAERLSGKQTPGIAPASRIRKNNCFKLTTIRQSKSDAPANGRVGVLA